MTISSDKLLNAIKLDLAGEYADNGHQPADRSQGGRDGGHGSGHGGNHSRHGSNRRGHGGNDGQHGGKERRGDNERHERGRKDAFPAEPRSHCSRRGSSIGGTGYGKRVCNGWRGRRQQSHG